MPANSGFPILFTLLVALFPIALYCLVLSSINRRPEPLVVRGVWDFAGVLFALSGILLWTAPAMLANLYYRAVTVDSERSFEATWWRWWLLWAAYYAIVAAGAIFLLWLRRSTTAIYNVDPERVPPLLAAALQRHGFEFAQNALGQFLIAPPRTMVAESLSTAVATEQTAQSLGAPEAGPMTFRAAVEVDPFPSLCHVTLHWYDAEPRLRREIENELGKGLAEARPSDNPASSWQLGASVVLFGAIILSVFYYILLLFMPRHW